MNDRVYMITGKPRIGKTTSIKNIIHFLGSDVCGGFYTEEIRGSTDRIGFRCVSVDGAYQEIANVNSNRPFRVGRYGIDVEGFEAFAIPLIETSLRSKKVIVMDEIGFMQLLSVPFQQLVMKIITESTHVILGTIPVDSHPFIDKIKCLSDITLFHIDQDNRETIVNDVFVALTD